MDYNKYSPYCQKLLEYIQAYNSRDIDKVMSFLSPELCTAMLDENGDEKVYCTSRETARPFYVKDFEKPNCEAKILSEPQDMEIDQDTVGITIKLLAVVPNKALKLTYYIRKSDMLHIKHLVHEVIDMN